MIDYFKELCNKLRSKNNTVEILKSNILECKSENVFDLFEFDISDEVKYLYNNYKRFLLSWVEKIHKLHGFVDFIPYDEISEEHELLCELTKDVDGDIIENQDLVIEDLNHWYPIFKFSNGDAFCYDNRNGKIVFFEHEVFDTGINLHGLVIAESIDALFDNWSKVMFIDIYDWYDGINEHGIDLSKSIYKEILQINNSLKEVNDSI